MYIQCMHGAQCAIPSSRQNSLTATSRIITHASEPIDTQKTRQRSKSNCRARARKRVYTRRDNANCFGCHYVIQCTPRAALDNTALIRRRQRAVNRATTCVKEHSIKAPQAVVRQFVNCATQRSTIVVGSALVSRSTPSTPSLMTTCG